MIFKGRLRLRLIQLLCISLMSSLCFGEEEESKPAAEEKKDLIDENATGTVTGKLSPVEQYQRLFRHKREAHREGVKTIMAIGDFEKQYKMLNMLFDKLFKVMTSSRVKLMESGFTPGDPLPQEEDTRNAFSSVAENTAFFGDILLRLPDITHELLQRNRDWDLVIRWAISFCDATNIYEKNDKILLNLMAQEMEIIEREPDYVNPYRRDRAEMLKQFEAEEKKEKEIKKKKKKKEMKRGPRLSTGGSRTEL